MVLSECGDKFEYKIKKKNVLRVIKRKHKKNEKIKENKIRKTISESLRKTGKSEKRRKTIFAFCIFRRRKVKFLNLKSCKYFLFLR